MNNNDYARIERALHFLAADFRQQPTLEDIAARVHLSEFHFQRLFTRWVGISPKKFLQYLTLDYAKQCLADSQTVLDASYSAGLSASSRLHDLFVTFESVSPGEYRRRGADLLIRYHSFDTLFGRCLLMATDRGVCGLSFIGDEEKSGILEMAGRWPEAQFVEDAEFTRPYTRTIAAIGRSGKGDKNEIKVALYGTAFQLQVWEALLRIPSGRRVTYQQIARAVDSPNAARAVGSAVGHNPVSWLVPCHRVIRSSGMLGGYHWGRARKLAMLGWESASSDNQLQLQQALVN